MKLENSFILAKSDAPAFFTGLAREMRLIAPKKRFGGDVIFDQVVSPKEIAWNYGHDLYPPKRFLLPHREDMFRYRAGSEPAIEASAAVPRQAIIGIRSCDVKAIRFQERFFGAPIVDPYYAARSEGTTLFSLVCNRPPRKDCFCICCDAGPYLDSGFDVQLTDLGDRFLYEIGSDKGRAAGEAGKHLLRTVGPEDLAIRRRIELAADSLFETTAYFAKALNFISYDEVAEAIWQKLGSTCFRCGACTNLCPVCTCYTVDDLAEEDGSYVRCRSWDSCQFSGFTREASGHNPRATSGRRLQRRFYHKVSYQYVQRDGTHGCVGCGRCVSTCLTNLGVPTVLKRIRRSMHEYLKSEHKSVEVR
ncbi:MAG TPA: 4Fe-4S dicluster domain-containing protein [Candidatus Bathyarchaeia archaeon]|nr:4Fe-4S dicluster domain-containing protein [Candidatus Bathyarchaeia archaeon]